LPTNEWSAANAGLYGSSWVERKRLQRRQENFGINGSARTDSNSFPAATYSIAMRDTLRRFGSESAAILPPFTPLSLRTQSVMAEQLVMSGFWVLGCR